jgi:hypothetical protein
VVAGYMAKQGGGGGLGGLLGGLLGGRAPAASGLASMLDMNGNGNALDDRRRSGQRGT